MRKLLIAISFFTRVPINVKDVTEDEFYNSMILIPFVGVFIGIILFVAAFLLSFIHFIELQALLLIIIYIWLTGGLHLDGFADTIDGLFSARDQKKMMEIMKDSRLGAFGAIGLILLVLSYWIGFQMILIHYPAALFVVPVFGRTTAIMATCFCHYAEGGGGLGKRFIEMTKRKHFIGYLILLLIFATVILGIVGLMVTILSYIPVILLLINLQKKIGGVTGDTIGMTIELSQIFFLMTLSILIINFPSYFTLFSGIF